MIALISAQILLAEASRAQDIREASITFSLQKTSLKAALQKLQKESGYNVFYLSPMVTPYRDISVPAATRTVYQTLELILLKTPFSFRQEGKTIILIDRAEPTPTLQPESHLQKNVRGRVTDEKGEGLPGVSILIKGTQQGTITDENGNYQLTIENDEAILIFSFVGYLSQEIPVGSRASLDISLKVDEKSLEEVVVVGYGTQRKANVTGAVDVISNDQIKNRQSPTVSQLLQGLSPAMTFSTNNYGFQPGAEMNINIRGTGSLNGGQPYVLIDGIPGDMNRINPEDIASISILKDAAASAIYGARAPYGVILITTKSGSADEKLSVSYSGNVSVATPQRLPSMLNSYTHARIVNEAGVWGAGGRVFSNETIDRIIAYQKGDFDYLKQFTVPDATYFETVALPNGTWGINQQGNANYDWIDEYYGSAVNQKHDLSVQGGSQKTSYYLSGGYVGQEGVLNYGTDTYSRVNIMAKIKTSIAPWWDIGYQPRFMKSNRVRPSMDKQGEYDLVFHQIARTMPTNAKYDAYGNLMIQSKIPWISDAGNDHIETTENWQSFNTEIRPLKNWKINADFAYQSVNIFRSHQEMVVYETMVDKSIVPTSNTIPSNIQEYHHNNNYWTTNIYTTFNTNIGEKQHLTFLAGTQFEKSNKRYLDVYKTNLLVQNVPSLRTASGEPAALDSLGHWSTQGYFARLNYDFDNRYLLEVNLRRDGTSRFRAGNRWGTFPSFSAGWNISNEGFWQPIRHVVNLLKFRGSWGRLGNQNVDSYLDLNLIPIQTAPLNYIFGFGQSRPIGSTTVPGLVSPNLTWETATTKDIGVDFAVLNRRLTGSFDWFERTTTDMIGPAEAQPGVLGTALPKANNSAFRTRGWELSLRWNQSLNPSFSYFVTGNLYDSRSFVTKYVNPTGTLSNSTWYEGREEGEIWGYTSNGLYRTQGDIDQHLASTDLSFIWNGIWKTGDVRYEDLNGDGKVNNGSNTVNDHGDLKIIGNSNPRYQYGVSAGFNWKNLDFSMLWRGTAKRDISFAALENIFWGFRHFNQVSLFDGHLDYFRDTEGDKYTGLYEGAANINLDSYWPRPYANDAENEKNRVASTRYLQSAAYLRLQNVQIGYNMPSSLASKLKMQRVRVYFSGENLLTLTSLSLGIDPLAISSERGAGKTYGADRMFSLGLMLTY